MAFEIERKFLVDRGHPFFQELQKMEKVDIAQGYLKSSKDGVVRVRVMGDKGFLTIKGANVGIKRPEFEYPIPVEDAVQMLDMCTDVLRKKRCFLPIGNLTFEIDFFQQIDLVLAEIELPDENTPFERPDWLGEDVSEDPAYFNNEILRRIAKAK